MAFDFPTSPAVNDEYASGGITYVWTGSAWDISGGGDLADKVSKDGDTMTGTLNFDARPSAEHAITIENDLGVETLKVSGSSAAHAGILEFYNDDGTRRGYIGYGAKGATVADNYLNLNPEGGTFHVNAGGLAMQEGANIRWGNTSAVTGVNDFSEGICLYGWPGTSKFGLCITGGTLNVSVENAANKIDMNIGGAMRLRVNTNGVYNPLKFYTTDTRDGWHGYFIGDNWHGMCFNGSNALQFIEYHAKWQFVKRQTGTTGGTVVYLIDEVGSVGNSVSGSAFLDRNLAEDPQLSAFVEGEDDADTGLQRRGVNVGQLLRWAMLEIIELKAEVAQLKGRK